MSLLKRIFMFLLAISLTLALGTVVFASDDNRYDVFDRHAQQSFVPSDLVYWVDNIYDEEHAIYAIVTTPLLRLRSEPSTDSEILAIVAGGTRLAVLYQLENWVKVDFEGNVGYLNTDFVRFHYGNVDTSYLAEQIVAHSLQFLGTPYVWGGNDLRRGVDCSGFVHHVFRDFGIVLYRSSAAMSRNGVAVGRNELLPGDLVFFDTMGGGRISHVGLYIGDGDFIHSTVPGVGGGVIISSLYEAYYLRTYRAARRVL